MLILSFLQIVVIAWIYGRHAEPLQEKSYPSCFHEHLLLEMCLCCSRLPYKFKVIFCFLRSQKFCVRCRSYGRKSRDIWHILEKMVVLFLRMLASHHSCRFNCKLRTVCHIQPSRSCAVLAYTYMYKCTNCHWSPSHSIYRSNLKEMKSCAEQKVSLPHFQQQCFGSMT